MKEKCLWFTGLPSSGKTTIAKALDKYFPNSILLDGDEIRDTPISKDVRFSVEDRAKHIRRMGYIAKMFVDKGITAICSFVSPSCAIRDEIRTYFKKDDFVEIHVDCTLEECKRRDVKGLYKKAIAGEIKNFTGIDAPYEKPLKPEIYLQTHDPNKTVKDHVNQILAYLGYNIPRQVSVFIGRWNSCYHKGHEYIIDQKLKAGNKVLMLVRDVIPDSNNPWTAKEVKEMLDYRYIENPNVDVMIIPDVKSIEYGRGVGYEVNEIKVDKQIAGISGTKCRELIAKGDDSWKEFVTPRIVEFLERKMK